MLRNGIVEQAPAELATGREDTAPMDAALACVPSCAKNPMSEAPTSGGELEQESLEDASAASDELEASSMQDALQAPAKPESSPG
eukprot:10031838-Alexandrium_andersonii.AAC.1